MRIKVDIKIRLNQILLYEIKKIKKWFKTKYITIKKNWGSNLI
jgi:hypothetical protein